MNCQGRYFVTAVRAAVYSASVMSIAVFCRTGCDAGAVAALEVDATPNSQGLVSSQVSHYLAAAHDLVILVEANLR